jgi:hypothetical protein
MKRRREIEMSTTETEVKISADTVAERILSAFDGQDGYLNGRDLVAASGVGRQQYLKILSGLIDETGEIIEVEANDDDPETVLYARPKPRRQAGPTGSQS